MKVSFRPDDPHRLKLDSLGDLAVQSPEGVYYGRQGEPRRSDCVEREHLIAVCVVTLSLDRRPHRVDIAEHGWPI